MKLLKLALVCYLVAVLGACAKHETNTAGFVAKHEFSGRLLVMSPKHRFQMEMDWSADENKGSLRLTHGLSGRIVHVLWENEKMLWRDNGSPSYWKPLSEQSLLEMGIILPPWTLARIFLGDMPSSMKTADSRTWKGQWGEVDLRVRWTNKQQRVELTDIKHGRRAVVVFDAPDL